MLIAARRAVVVERFGERDLGLDRRVGEQRVLDAGAFPEKQPVQRPRARAKRDQHDARKKNSGRQRNGAVEITQTFEVERCGHNHGEDDAKEAGEKAQHDGAAAKDFQHRDSRRGHVRRGVPLGGESVDGVRESTVEFVYAAQDDGYAEDDSDES